MALYLTSLSLSLYTKALHWLLFPLFSYFQYLTSFQSYFLIVYQSIYCMREYHFVLMFLYIMPLAFSAQISVSSSCERLEGFIWHQLFTFDSDELYISLKTIRCFGKRHLLILYGLIFVSLDFPSIVYCTISVTA